MDRTIYDYHEGDRSSWRAYERYEGSLHGIELELDFRGATWDGEEDDYYIEDSASDNALSFVDSLKNPTKRQGPAPVFELDGSILNGVEIIFPPTPPRLLRSRHSYIASVVKMAASRVDLHLHSKTGMHFNINIYKWKPHHVAAFIALMHNIPRKLYIKIGGRNLTSYCKRTANLRVEAYDNRQYTEEGDCLAEHDDHDSVAAVRIDSDRIECRFPAATTDLNKIAMISLFFEEAEKFARKFPEADKEKKAGEWLFDSFVDYLKKKRTIDSLKVLDYIGEADASTKNSDSSQARTL